MGWISMSGRELHRIEVVSEVLARRRSEISAAAILGLSTRQTRRLLAAYGDGGDGALIHKARARTSNNRLIPGIREYGSNWFGRAMPISARAWRWRFCSRRTESSLARDAAQVDASSEEAFISRACGVKPTAS
jgi:hypothetical protein